MVAVAKGGQCAQSGMDRNESTLYKENSKSRDGQKGHALRTRRSLFFRERGFKSISNAETCPKTRS